MNYSRHDISIVGEISVDTMTRVKHELINLSKKRRKNVNVFIYSGGGDADAANSIAGLLRNSGFNITTIGSGRVESAALKIFFSGHKKIAHDKTIFMSHACESLILGGKMGILQRISQQQKINIHNKWASGLLPYGPFGFEKFYTSDDLLEKGLIDKII